MKRLWLTLFMSVMLVACGQGADIEDAASQNTEPNQTEVENTSNKKENEEKQEPGNQEENAEKEKVKENEKEEEEKSKEEKPKREKKKTSLSDLKVHYIDVGQADATLFQYKENGKAYTILYDAGDWNKNDLIDYLAGQTIDKIDLIIISHPHADHIGQLEKVMHTYEVEEVWMSGNTSSSGTFQAALEAVLESGASYHEPRAGESFDVGTMGIEILHPSSLTGKLNEDSISARFTYGDLSFVFTGDAYKNEERQMMNRSAGVAATFLQLGHHGSDTSSDPAFIKAVDPDVAIYSASSNNSYGHPNASVVSTIQDAGITLYGTDVHGTIIVTTDGKKYDIKTKQDGRVTAKEEKKQAPKKKTEKAKPKKEPEQEKQPSSNCIDINSASEEELQRIIHIGPERAKDLIELRPFNRVDDLTRISGIGPARIDDIKNQGKACTN